VDFDAAERCPTRQILGQNDRTTRLGRCRDQQRVPVGRVAGHRIDQRGTSRIGRYRNQGKKESQSFTCAAASATGIIRLRVTTA
jgi:hypothetical protein